jgi:CheY-like chemotaxis protein
VHLPQLSELFYRVDTTGGKDRQGVGLGLAIVDRLTRLCGLQLRLISQPGHGVMAAIDGLAPVIVAADTSATGTDPQAAMDLSFPSRKLTGTRVLLIEDDLDLLAATRELLMSWHCHVQAFAAMPIRVEPWDIIITDMDIGGGMSGVDCIRVLRADAARNGAAVVLPAIVMTGHGIDRSVADWPDRTVTLSKPISPLAIHNAMLQLLATD